jgi:hypothetical protein
VFNPSQYQYSIEVRSCECWGGMVPDLDLRAMFSLRVVTSVGDAEEETATRTSADLDLPQP